MSYKMKILKVSDDLCRFKDMLLRVCYVEDYAEKNGVFMLESTDREIEKCVWKLADARENRDPQSKGRPLNRKQKEWTLRLPFLVHKKFLARKHPSCCVSFSSFYNETITLCPFCACGCENQKSCVKSDSKILSMVGINTPRKIISMNQGRRERKREKVTAFIL